MFKKEKVLIAGGTGFIGLHLAKFLSEHNFKVAILSRGNRNKTKFEIFKWNIEKQFIQEGAINDTDYLINLAGTNIASGRWSKKRKRDILESRIKSSELLFNCVQNHKTKLKAYIGASAVGIYGNKTTTEIFDEAQDVGDDFLATVCYKWEQASLKFANIGTRTVILRTGVVLNKNEGAFPKMTQGLKFGFIAGVGSGKQYLPWIHLDDLLSQYLFAIQNKKMDGIFNAVAPGHLTQNELVSKINLRSKSVRIPNLPGFMLKLILGKMASILLEGSRISSSKITTIGFKFKFSSIDEALEKLLKPKS